MYSEGFGDHALSGRLHEKGENAAARNASIVQRTASVYGQRCLPVQSP